MSIRIVADSCCEYPEELKNEVKCVNVPLILTVDDRTVVDDESFDQKEFLALIADSKGVPRSAC
ncbi:MAG: DegV family protein, partial [Lachnospiraceae bacterium]|nr:DegV family protein [Lachnospiraceae bacterium]